MNLNTQERELLLEETDAVIDQSREPQRGRYVALREAIAANAVGDEAVGTLESLLALELNTGRARKIHGPMAESALLRLYGRTPTGNALQENSRQVNTALNALQGQMLEGVKFAPKGPGSYTLDIETEEYQVHLEIRPEGIWVKQIELDL